MADVAICEDCHLRLPGELGHGPPCRCSNAKEKQTKVYTKRFGRRAAKEMIAAMYPSPKKKA